VDLQAPVSADAWIIDGVSLVIYFLSRADFGWVQRPHDVMRTFCKLVKRTAIAKITKRANDNQQASRIADKAQTKSEGRYKKSGRRSVPPRCASLKVNAQRGDEAGT
jgi:hypothetical protein